MVTKKGKKLLDNILRKTEITKNKTVKEHFQDKKTTFSITVKELS